MIIFLHQVWIAEEEIEKVGRNVRQWRMHNIAHCTLRGLPDRVDDDDCEHLIPVKIMGAFARKSSSVVKTPICYTTTIPARFLNLKRSVLPSNHSTQLDFCY
jgi:hypothetical protein